MNKNIFGVEFRGEFFPKNFKFEKRFETEDLPDFGIIGIAVAYLPNDFDQVIVADHGDIATMHPDRFNQKKGNYERKTKSV